MIQLRCMITYKTKNKIKSMHKLLPCIAAITVASATASAFDLNGIKLYNVTPSSAAGIDLSSLEIPSNVDYFTFTPTNVTPSAIAIQGNTLATATLIKVGGNTQSNLEKPGEVDYFKFILPTDGSLLISTASNVPDVYGVLLDAAGETIQTDEDSGAGSGFQIQRNMKAGTYYIAVASTPKQTGRYVLVTRFFAGAVTPQPTPAPAPTPAPSADDHGNTVAAATPITIGLNNLVGALESAGDVDVFKFTAATNSEVLLAVHQLATRIDATLTLLDSSGNALQSVNSPSSFSRLIPAGTYYISVKGNGNSTGRYSLIARLAKR